MVLNNKNINIKWQFGKMTKDYFLPVTIRAFGEDQIVIAGIDRAGYALCCLVMRFFVRFHGPHT